jgi:hypothetical protein
VFLKGQSYSVHNTEKEMKCSLLYIYQQNEKTERWEEKVTHSDLEVSQALGSIGESSSISITTLPSNGMWGYLSVLLALSIAVTKSRCC